MLNRDTSFDFMDDSRLLLSGRIFSVTMLLTGYLLLSSYGAVLVSYLAVTTVVLPFNNVEGLIESNYQVAQWTGSTKTIMEFAPKDSSKIHTCDTVTPKCYTYLII
jgi:hypothetical protein